MKYNRILSEFYSTPWAITPQKLETIASFLNAASMGISAENFTAAHKPSVSTAGAVAVIPVFGTITQRADMMTDISGGTSTQRLSKQIAMYMNDDSVGAIVLDVDSPGGSVYGVQELAAEIRAARGHKRIVAVANSLMASAVYWIASAADEIVVTPSGEVGSIGVLAAHQDHSEAMEKEGVKTTLVYAGKHKVEGNPYEPLADEALNAMQSRIDEYYDEFVKAVANNRGATPSAVRDGYGQGRVVGANEAVATGLADRVDTLENTIARLATKRNQNARTRSARLKNLGIR